MGLDYYLMSVPPESQLYKDASDHPCDDDVQSIASVAWWLSDKRLLSDLFAEGKEDFVRGRMWVEELLRLWPSIQERRADIYRNPHMEFWLIERMYQLTIPPKWIMYGERHLGGSGSSDGGVWLNSPETCVKIANALAQITPNTALEYFKEINASSEANDRYNRYSGSEEEAADLTAKIAADELLKLRGFYLDAARHGDAAIASIR